MPTKHTRREKDLSTFDLPPTEFAKPLPVTSISQKNDLPAKKNGQNKGGKQKGKKNEPPSSSDAPPKSYMKRKRGEGAGADDVPRAFKRLMAFASGQKTRDGLDNGEREPKGKKKKAKKTVPSTTPGSAATDPKDELTIRPGERLSEFNQRVDAALPISGLVTKVLVKDGKDPLGIKVKRTKKERKMHKLYAEWREEDAKIKEKREEEAEEAEEREMEDANLGVTWKLDQEAQGKKKKGKRGKHIGESTGKEEDPWNEIVKKRGEAKVGINEVANAPPDLKKSQPKLKEVRGARVDVNDIPKAAGSLAKREELQSIRDDVVAQYRALMNERRAAVALGKTGEEDSD
ncbi:hypothetical protein B0H63DRAFT_562368 [Podospora didyma]|uniref:Uncharacterized protein n=1 Tax=Podospora didyma TaxID=330526 RepID=A0AAE0KLX9_9PEZI|nr:hypothetical protein B0H63DRAFT_562368 [Podospora didyma]